MNILADENVDAAIVLLLRSQGHDVLWMVEHAPGTPDPKILTLAQAQQRIIVTFDRDFGELVFHRGREAPGIILLRIGSQSPEAMLASFQNLWPQLQVKAPGHFIVVANNKVRIRPIAHSNKN